MPPVISMTVHSDIQGALGFPDILFSTLATRYQVHNILRSTIGVAFQLDCLAQNVVLVSTSVRQGLTS